MRRAAGLLLSSLVLFAPPLVAAPGVSSGVDTVEVTAESSPAVRLAFFDVGEVQLTRDTVEAYEELLSRLSGECRTSPGVLARKARGGASILRRHGVSDIPAFTVLDRLENAIGGPLNAQPQCDELMADALLRIGGSRLDVPRGKITDELTGIRPPTGG